MLIKANCQQLQEKVKHKTLYSAIRNEFNSFLQKQNLFKEFQLLLHILLYEPVQNHQLRHSYQLQELDLK